MSIDEMQAGREMDALVAELLGWTEVKKEESYIVGGHGTGIMPGETTINGNGNLLRSYIPLYSTDIAAAWIVAEKMAEEWPDFGVSHDNDGWTTLWGFDGHGWDTATAETAPLAICRATLKALGVSS